MVSYIQVEGYGLEQGFKGVVSNRPKAQSLQQEDQFFFYEYDRRGGLKKKTPKSILQQYAYWHRHIAHDSKMKRILPLTEFEKQMGVRGGAGIPTIRYKWCIRSGYGCQERTFTEEEWRIFTKSHTIDYGAVETWYQPDLPVHLGQGNYDWSQYWKDHAEKMDLITVNVSQLEFKKKHPYCIANNIHGSNCNIESTPELAPPVVEKIPTPARPNPREVEKPEPVEVEPIKEVVKYSPLMIAGVIAVVVILLLKRRRA